MWQALLLVGSLQAPAPLVWPHPVPGAPTLERVHEDVFRKFDVDYLQVTFYVELRGLKRRPRATAPRAWLLQGRTWCGRRSRVLHEIGGIKRAEGLRAQLAAHWPEGAFDPARPSVVQLLDSATHPLEVGDLIDYVWAPAGQVHIRYGAGPWRVFADPLLHQALLRIAFGNATDPEMAGMDRDLARISP
jgi:hypothetical protein